MPSLFTNSSAAKGSTRRPRGESESRRPTSHRVDSERRRTAKESSSSRNNDRRSPPSAKPNPSTANIYSQPNVAQEPTPASPISDSEASTLSSQSPEMRLITPAASANNYQQYQLETPSSLLQYLDTTDDEDADATPQPKKESVLQPPALRRQPAITAPVVPSPTPSKQEIQSRPLTPDSNDAKDDNETVTGSPQHMSMSMPHLRRDLSQDGQPPPPSPLSHRAFTPPVAQRQYNSPQLAQPMPVYPYHMQQDPRAYYTQPMQHMPQQQQQQQQQQQHMQQPQQQQQLPPQAPPPMQYMYEPRYDESRYDMGPRQPMHSYYNQSPDPYRNHRLSMASAGAESHYTQDSGDRVTVASHGHTATGRTSPQEETSDLLSRIQSAMPDLALLLSRCEEVTGHSTHHKEQKLLTSGPSEDAHLESLLKQKDARIEELEKELAEKTKTHVVERNKMRFEIGNLQEQYTDLQDDLVSFKRDSVSGGSSKGAPEPSGNEALCKELEASKCKVSELAEAKATSDRCRANLESQLRSLTSELESRKSSEISLQRERDSLIAAAAAAASAGPGKSGDGLREMNETLMREKRELEALVRSKDSRLEESRKIWMKDIETARAAGARDLASAKEAAARELEDAKKSWSREKETLVQSQSEEVSRLKLDLSNQKADHEKDSKSQQRKHEKALTDLEKGLEAKFEEKFAEQLKEADAEVSKARRDYKRVKRDWHVEKERAYEERGKVRSGAGRMREECERLVKLLEAYSEPLEREREGGRERGDRKKRSGRVEVADEEDYMSFGA